LTTLLGVFSEHNEPLVNTLRLAMLIISVLWVVLIAQGKTLYPRWVAIFSPIALLLTIFVIYFYISPALGVWLLPAAMNVVHVIIFALSIYVLRGLQKIS
jgi:nicotinamide riboside transporter PnuC